MSLFLQTPQFYIQHVPPLCAEWWRFFYARWEKIFILKEREEVEREREREEREDKNTNNIGDVRKHKIYYLVKGSKKNNRSC